MNHKRILAFVLVILFAFSLFACGESTYADPGESTSAPGEETEAESIPEKPKTAFKRVKRSICKKGDTTETYDFKWDENSCAIKLDSQESVAFYDPNERLFSIQLEKETIPLIKYDENGMIHIMYDDDGVDRYVKVTGYDENNVPTGISTLRDDLSETKMFEYDPATRTVTEERGTGHRKEEDGTMVFIRRSNEYVLGEFGNISAAFRSTYESIGDEEHFEFKEKTPSSEKWEYDADGNLIRYTKDSVSYEFEYSDEVIHEPWERLMPAMKIEFFMYSSLPWFWQLKGWTQQCRGRIMSASGDFLLPVRPYRKR